MKTSETQHGTRERVSWIVTVTDPQGTQSHRLCGESEDKAREWYELRRRNLHRGHSIRLERVLKVETWVQHTDYIEIFDKPVAVPA